MKKWPIIFLSFLMLGCEPQAELTGLWELHKMDVDMIPKRFNPTYIKFESNGSFSVSKEDGDIAGLYELENSLLSLSSNDQKWFNRKWKVIATENELVFNDVKNSFRGAQMRFNKIDKFPSFEEFMDRLNGKWELYKIVEKGEERRVKQTWFMIQNDRYILMEGDEQTEEGAIRVDTRHHKITFETMAITWSVRFVWDDLRLENEELGLMYRLRKKVKTE